jgi:hypothetical protein
MTRGEKKLTGAEAILLAASDLTAAGSVEFSEWQLSVATWKRDPSKFGMRGFESQYPDHKRVMKEIMGSAPRNPVVRGLLERVRENHYRLTPVGRTEVTKITAAEDVNASPRSASELYDGIRQYAEHRVFLEWLRNPDEPRTWLGAAAFLELTTHDPTELKKALRAPVVLATDALEWLEENHRDHITRGPVGGGKPITRKDLHKLRDFVGVLQARFASQIGAIERRGSQLR